MEYDGGSRLPYYCPKLKSPDVNPRENGNYINNSITKISFSMDDTVWAIRKLAATWIPLKAVKWNLWKINENNNKTKIIDKQRYNNKMKCKLWNFGVTNVIYLPKPQTQNSSFYADICIPISSFKFKCYLNDEFSIVSPADEFRHNQCIYVL